LDEEPETKLRGPYVVQPVPVGEYEIYVLGVGEAAETTFKSPRKMSVIIRPAYYIIKA
jgi:hypothetical protein